MHALLNMVDVTALNIILFSDFSGVYPLLNRSCVGSGLCDFAITVYNSCTKEEKQVFRFENLARSLFFGNIPYSLPSSCAYG
jgi:hypothetical protein